MYNKVKIINNVCASVVALFATNATFHLRFLKKGPQGTFYFILAHFAYIRYDIVILTKFFQILSILLHTCMSAKLRRTEIREVRLGFLLQKKEYRTQQAAS